MQRLTFLEGGTLEQLQPVISDMVEQHRTQPTDAPIGGKALEPDGQGQVWVSPCKPFGGPLPFTNAGAGPVRSVGKLAHEVVRTDLEVRVLCQMREVVHRRQE